MRTDKKPPQKTVKKTSSRVHSRGVVGYSKKSALLEEAITHMNAGKYGRSSASLKELLSLDPHNTEARRLFATLHLRLGSLVTARQAFESIANEAIERQDLWLAESLLRELGWREFSQHLLHHFPRLSSLIAVALSRRYELHHSPSALDAHPAQGKFSLPCRLC